MTLKLARFEHIIEGAYQDEIELTFAHNLFEYQEVGIERLPATARQALTSYINQDFSEPVTYMIAGFSAEASGFYAIDEQRVIVGLRRTAPSSVSKIDALVLKNPRFMGWLRDIGELLREAA
jgi:hypothetical protein